MPEHEKSRLAASTDMNAQWAQGLGKCGLCQNAADGGCSIVNALAEAAGVPLRDAQGAILKRMEVETRKAEIS